MSTRSSRSNASTHPRLTDDAFAVAVNATPRHADRLDVWWLGQSGFLIQWHEHRLLIDAYLSDSLTAKYAGTDRPHERISDRVVDPVLLTNITHVLATHFHTDALDTLTLAPIVTRCPALQFIGPRAIQETIIERLGRPADVLLSDGESVELDGDICVHAIPAEHDLTASRDVHDNALFLGYVVRLGPFFIFHAGDTVDHPPLATSVRVAAPGLDLAMLPIGRPPAGPFVSMNAIQAADLAATLQPRLAVPMHFGIFAHTVASPAEFVERCSNLGVPARQLAVGEQVTLFRRSEGPEPHAGPVHELPASSPHRSRLPFN